MDPPTDNTNVPANNQNEQEPNNSKSSKANGNKIIQYGVWSRHDNTTGPIPFARNGHKMVVHKDNLYVFGGNNKEEDQSGELHVYSPETKKWNSLTKGPALTRHSAVVHRDRLVVFGGTGLQELRHFFRGISHVSALLNDVWFYRFDQQEWTLYQVTGSLPPERDGHTAVVHNDNMYIFGGSNNMSVFGDLFSLLLSGDKGIWMRARSEGTIPSPRRLHSCVLWNDCLWVFGGYDGKTSFNDVHMYNITTGIWSVPTTSGVPPLQRFGHTAVVYKDFMYILGGYGARTGFLNDLHHYHFPTGTWTLISEKTSLTSRREHSAEVHNNEMFVFGGGTGSSTYTNDLWSYKFSNEVVEEVKSTLTEDLLKMLDNPAYYPDAIFRVGTKTIRAHKCILSARCEYFNSRFKSAFQGASSGEIDIDDVSEDVFMALLQYLYGGPAHLITPEVSFELLTISERYMLPHLKWLCETVVVGGVAVENVVSLLVASETYNCTRLRRTCLDFMVHNHQHVVATEEFKTIPHGLLLEVMSIISAAK